MISSKKIKRITFVTAFFAPLLSLAQPNFATKSAKIGFFSSTPIEDIKASSTQASAVLIANGNHIAFQVPVKTFEFEKKLMQEHFNENYMESDRFPLAKFKGTINQNVDLNKDGEYNVSASGILLIHGVEKQRTINGKLKVSGQTVQLLSNFEVPCADHQIKIPRLVMTKIAEVIKVNVSATLAPIPN